MRRAVPAVVLLIALGAAILAVTASGATGRRAHARAADHRSFTLIEHATTDATTDTGAPGDSAGDILTFANAVYNAGDTRQVGTDQGYCIRTEPGKSYECAWTNRLKGGQVMVQGPFFDAQDSVLAVTGGTGAYSGVRGTMRLHARNGGTQYAFQFHLR